MLTSWIPSAFGRVSFSQIGSANSPGSRERINFSDGRNRYIVVRELRATRDSLASAFHLHRIDQTFHKLSNRFDFIICGKSSFEEFDRQNSLVGKIFINPRDDGKISQLSARYTSLAEGLKSAASLAAHASEWRSPFDKLMRDQNETSFGELVGSMESNSYLTIDYSMNRFGRFDVNYASHSLPVEKRDDEEAIIDSLLKGCFHAYLFAKDAAHQHTHHDPQSDSILDLYLNYDRTELSLTSLETGRKYRLEPKVGVEPNDINWREEVLYALHRRASALQMDSNVQDLSLSRGLIKYASVFSDQFSLVDKTRANTRRFSPEQMDKYSWPTYDLDNGFEIVETRIEEIKSRDSDHLEFSKAIYAISLTLTTIILSYTSLLRLIGLEPNDSAGLISIHEVDNLLIDFATKLLKYFRWIVFGIFALYIITHRRVLWKWFRGIPVLTKLRRLALRFYLHAVSSGQSQKWKVLFIFLLLSVLSGYFGLKFLF